MVKPSLTQRAALSRAAETIRQSVSGNPCGQPAAVRLKDFSMSRAASTAPLRKKWRRFRRNRRGSAAVEFALVAPVFFALLFAIIETAIMFFASQVLETMTANASRLIMTGTEQNSGTSSLADFQQKVCNQIPALFSCANISVDVQTVPTFSNVSLQQSDRCQRHFHASQQLPAGRLQQHRCREGILSVAAVRHRTWLQHLEHGRQQAIAYRHGRVPERTLLRQGDEDGLGDVARRQA